MRPLRPHQLQAIAGLRLSLGSGHRRVIVQAPTGFGKTLLASHIVSGALAKGNRVMFVVPSLSLIDQTVQRFGEDGILAVGVIQADHYLTDYSKPVQVCSVDTLKRRNFPPSDLVILDECHRWHKFYGQWMSDPEWLGVPFIGLSATPWTRGLGKHFSDLIIASTTRELIDDGYLSDFRVFAPTHPDLTGVKIVAGDYHEGQLADAVDRPPLVADIVRTWQDHGEGRPTLLFAVNRAHAKHLQDAFIAGGVSAGYIDAYTDAADRKVIEKEFHAGTIKVVCNVGCLTTGIDWDVRCIILARPTRSEMLFVQMVGRSLRTAEGKKDALIFDHSDTHLRLGFVTDIYHDELDTGKKKEAKQAVKKEALPKECAKCHFLKPPKVSLCPVCGFKPSAQSEVEHVDGELIEVTKGASKAEKQRWYSMLMSHARSRGYSDGWIANQYRKKFAVWPRQLEAVCVTPDAEVAGYIKSRQIAYAKAMEKKKKATEIELTFARDIGLAQLDAMLAKPC